VAEWETIQERLISGKGVLKVPTDVKKNRAYVLFATVIREPRNKYLSFNWNPAKSRYGNLVFLREGYVVDTLPIEFTKQVFDGINDISGQTLIALKCAYVGVLDSLVNLSLAIGGTPGGIGITPISYVDEIKDYENLRLAWDEVRLQCYADTAISLRLDRLKYDSCSPDKDKDNPPPPPPPPEDNPPIPPGTPIVNISDPYDGTDDGNTVPFEGDEFPTPPGEGGDCAPVTVTIIATEYNAIGDPTGGTTTSNIAVFGPVFGVRTVPSGSQVQFEIDCRGIQASTPTCIARAWYPYLISGYGNVISYTVA